MKTVRAGTYQRTLKRLSQHKELMDQLVLEGMPRAEASREAFRRMEAGIRREERNRARTERQ